MPFNMTGPVTHEHFRSLVDEFVYDEKDTDESTDDSSFGDPCILYEQASCLSQPLMELGMGLETVLGLQEWMMGGEVQNP